MKGKILPEIPVLTIGTEKVTFSNVFSTNILVGLKIILTGEEEETIAEAFKLMIQSHG